MLGALAASGLLALMFPSHETLGATLPVGPVWRAFVLEVVITFMLMLVILAVASGPKERGLVAGSRSAASWLSRRCSRGPSAAHP